MITNFYRNQIAKDRYNRCYLGKNGGMTRKEMVGEVVGGIALMALAVFFIAAI